jgi:hypothetical protein
MVLLAKCSAKFRQLTAKSSEAPGTTDVRRDLFLPGATQGTFSLELCEDSSLAMFSSSLAAKRYKRYVRSYPANVLKSTQVARS